jgi:hypothetical protein
MDFRHEGGQPFNSIDEPYSAPSLRTQTATGTLTLIGDIRVIRYYVNNEGSIY